MLRKNIAYVAVDLLQILVYNVVKGLRNKVSHKCENCVWHAVAKTMRTGVFSKCVEFLGTVAASYVKNRKSVRKQRRQTNESVAFGRRERARQKRGNR